MAEQNKDSSMEEILSSIKRIIAEDKSIEIDRAELRKQNIAKPNKKPALQAVPDVADQNIRDSDDDEVLELTDALSEQPPSSDRDGLGDSRKEERLIDDQKLDSMRQSLSALVAMEKADKPAVAKAPDGTSLEDLTRDLLRPMLKQWLDDNLPTLVEELVAQEIQRISQN